MRGVLTTSLSEGASTAMPPQSAAWPRRAVLASCLAAWATFAGAAPASGIRAGKAPTAGAHARAPAAPAPAAPAQSAVTLYALNCMGCHPPPSTPNADRGPLRGEFYHSPVGRNFFIRVPQDGKRILDAQEEARLLDEIMTWKRSCAAILQDAPQVNYSGERFVK